MLKLFYSFWIFFDNFDIFLPILSMFDNFLYNFHRFLTFWNLLKILRITTSQPLWTFKDIWDNWEPPFMTIIVTRQLTEQWTLNSIRNSCAVLSMSHFWWSMREKSDFFKRISESRVQVMSCQIKFCQKCNANPIYHGAQVKNPIFLRVWLNLGLRWCRAK